MKSLLPFTFLFAMAASGATIVHDYNLTKSLNDIVGSANLSSDGGTVSSSGYTFAANLGLNVSSALTNTADYSILTDFSYQTLGGYQKLIDFIDRSSDNGFYTLGNQLNFYPAATGPIAFAPNTPARVVLTRDAGTNLVSGYVNGVSQFTFTDTTSIAVFSATNGLIRFFEDDFNTGQREAAAGTATRISIYNGALSAAAVASLGGPSLPTSATPEPVSFLLFGTGLAGVFVAKRRNRA